MPESQLIPQREATFLVTPGEGRQERVDLLRQCAQLVRIVAGSYVYRVSPVAIWGAAARGVSAADLMRQLHQFASQPLPAPLVKRIVEPYARYGVLRLRDANGQPIVVASDPSVLKALQGTFAIEATLGELALHPHEVGAFRIAAAKSGWPVIDDRVPVREGAAAFILRPEVVLRDYQREAVQAFSRVRDGVVLLPCGSGKTVVGIAAAAATSTRTLVLTPSRTVAKQWAEHFRTHTTATPADVVELERGGELRPVTIATYQLATVGTSTGSLFDHPWGLVIYDEVQSLPAEVFRNAAAFSAARRLGLTATLVREDGLEREVVALVGPVVFDVPWTELEHQGWIAPARCVEVRLPAARDPHEAGRYKLAATERLLAQHCDDQTIVIGTDVPLLRRMARRFDIPILTGSSPQRQRDDLLRDFRHGARQCIALSRIGTVGIDIPNATVLIQISGTFGSRQEEAQRLGRILRPAPGKVATFYSIVVENPRDVAFAARRQRFLVDQGYQYEILPASDLPRIVAT